MSIDGQTSGAAEPGGRPNRFLTSSDPDLAKMLAYDHLDALHAYVVALDRVLGRCGELGVARTQRALEAVQPPGDGLPVGHLLERKRRELLERFGLARHQHLFLPDVPLENWLRFFFAAAEMNGADAVTVDWQPDAVGELPRQSVAVSDGVRFQLTVRAAGKTLADVRELSYVAPSGEHLAALNVATSWLAIAAHPWHFGQTLRELDRLTGMTPLDIHLSTDLGRELQEGVGLVVRLHVRNLTPDVLVLEDLATDHRYDPREGFTQKSLGTLAYDATANRYQYVATAAGVTATAFRTAVLGPGQERVLTMTLKLLEGGEWWRTFTLRYQRFAIDDFRKHAYVPVPGSISQFPPEVFYGPVAELPDPASADLTTVVLNTAPGDLASMHWAYPFHVGQRSFSLAQARGRVSDDSEPVHFSRWQQAWVMALAEGCALVSPSRVTLYPRIDPCAFVVIDDAEQRVPVRFHAALLPIYRSLPLGIMDWDSHGLGLSVSLPKLKLTCFFQEIERMGVALVVEKNLLGRPTLWVCP
jgi:hypothetical protein